MVVLLGIGFLAGIITSVSPCVLPVLPILLAGSAGGSRRRPYAIIAGLVASFSVFTLAGAWLLDSLSLPQDLLRNLALALLFLVAATLIVPSLGTALERPFVALTRRRSGDLGGGFLLGASLGLVFVPCAGPVLAVVTVLSATRSVGLEGVLLTVAYAAGAAVPMLLVALGGQRAAHRTRLLREHAVAFRRGLGVVVGATALAIALNVDSRFQTAVPGYTSALQSRIEDNAYARRELAELSGNKDGPSRAAGAADLDDFGTAPGFRGISSWFNTPGDGPLSNEALRGKVVLVDFWTYTCINCLRTLPHVEGWYERYRDSGLVVVGVHTPEFAFEGVPSNVSDAVDRLGVTYPVALDDDYATWNAYGNRYWPAKYLIDRRGHVRYAHFGEGRYDETEDAIRALLAEPGQRLPSRLRRPDPTPTHPTTQETYLGYARLSGNVGEEVLPGRRRYALPASLPRNTIAFGGTWRSEPERAIAVKDARLRLHFFARDVFLVLSGNGRVDVALNGAPLTTVRVNANRLYTLSRLPQPTDGVLDLRFTPGVAGYAFTFG